MRLRTRPVVEALESRSLPSASVPTAEPFLAAVPNGVGGSAPYTPAQISSAYGFNQITFTGPNGQSVKGDGTGQTIAIVDAYSDPTLAGDLATFSRAFGLPAANLAVATPQGAVGSNALWDEEISLDVEWAHAMAPKANILLVEAKSSSMLDLLNAVSYAAGQAGVSVVSMSWGAGEFSSETSLDSYLETPAGHTNVAFVSSAGDSGAGAGPTWPSISPNVLSVGGTSLTLNTSGGYGGESAWSSGGGGYSKYERKPAYQNGAQSSSMRSNPDVSYDANPSTGYYVYDAGMGGWIELGGTSAGSPQWAALVAIADQGRALQGHAALANVPADVYALPSSDFHDVTVGSNGYSAHAGYDPATGLGSPVANKVVAGLLTVELPPSGGGGGGGGGGSSGGSFGGLNWSGWALTSRSSTLIVAGPGRPAGQSGAPMLAAPGAPVAFTTESAGPASNSNTSAPSVPATSGSVFYCFDNSRWRLGVESSWGYRGNPAFASTH